MKNKREEAVSYFNNGFNCAQAVLSTFGTTLGLDKETALKIACGFGGGMGRMQETCGAVTGAFMLIGLKFGKVKSEDDESKEKTYQLVREFSELFREKHGSIKCEDIIDCDISTPEGRQLYKEKDLSKKCIECVEDAVSIVEKLLGY